MAQRPRPIVLPGQGTTVNNPLASAGTFLKLAEFQRQKQAEAQEQEDKKAQQLNLLQALGGIAQSQPDIGLGQLTEGGPSFSIPQLAKTQLDPQQQAMAESIAGGGLPTEVSKTFLQQLLPGETGLESLAPGTEGFAGATDVERFVQRADQASVQETGEPLSFTAKNKAALQFKRAQAEEATAVEWAKKNVDSETAEKINFNSNLGKRLAEVSTEAKLRTAKGEKSPEEKLNGARSRMGGHLSSMVRHYLNLDSMGGVVNVDKSTSENISARMKSSAIGQFFGNAIGTTAQSERNSIKSIKPLMINEVRLASEMGARGMDSEKELEFYLASTTDEKRELKSNLAAIIRLDDAYGDGKTTELIRELLGDGEIERLINENSEAFLNLSKKKDGKPTKKKATDSLESKIKRRDELRRKLGR